MYVSLSVCVCALCGQGPKEAGRWHQIPGAGVAAVVSSSVWVLGTEPGSLVRAEGALICRAISPVSPQLFGERPVSSWFMWCWASKQGLVQARQAAPNFSMHIAPFAVIL